MSVKHPCWLYHTKTGCHGCFTTSPFSSPQTSEDEGDDDGFGDDNDDDEDKDASSSGDEEMTAS